MSNLNFENIIALVEELLQEKSKSEGAEQPMPKWLQSLTTDAGDVDKEFRRRQKYDTNKARSDKAALDRWQNLVTKPREQMAAKAMRDLQSRPDRIKSQMPKKRPSAQDIRSMDAQEKLKAIQQREREDVELKKIFKQLDKERALTRKSVGAFPKVATDTERKTTAARKKLKSMQDQARWDIGKRKNLAKLKNQLSTLQKYYPNSQAREEAEEKLEIFRANLAPWESPKRVYDKKTELSTEPYSFEKGLPPEAGSAATAAMVTGKPEWARGHLEPHSFEPRHAYKGVDWFLTSPLPPPAGVETKEKKEEREQINRERAEERYQRWGIKPGSPEAADAVDSEASLAKRKKAAAAEKKAAPTAAPSKDLIKVDPETAVSDKVDPETDVSDEETEEEEAARRGWLSGAEEAELDAIFKAGMDTVERGQEDGTYDELPGEDDEEEAQIPKELLKNIVNVGYKKIPGIKNEVKIDPAGIVIDKGKWRRNYEISAAGMLNYGTDWVKLKDMHLTTKGGLFIEMAAKLNSMGEMGVSNEELERLKKEGHEGVMYSKTVLAADEWRGLFEELGKLEKGNDVKQCITPTGRSEEVCINFKRTR